MQPLQYVLEVNRLEDAQNHPTVLKALGIRKLLGRGNEKEAIPKAEDAVHTLQVSTKQLLVQGQLGLKQ